MAAKRRLLSRAAVRALKDDAVVDVEARLVRTLNALDTLDVRALVVVASVDRASSTRPGTIYVDDVSRQIRANPPVTMAVLAELQGLGLVDDPSVGALRPDASVWITPYGDDVVRMLREEGLDDELGAATAT